MGRKLKLQALLQMIGGLILLSGCSGLSEEEVEDVARDDVASYSYVDIRGKGACTIDCSGHEAGFEWAKERAIADASDCGGNSASFIEGCEAYAEELEEARDRVREDGL